MEKTKVVSNQKPLAQNSKTLNRKNKSRKTLPINVKIASGKKNVMWKIVEHIGSGGFGDVYRVTPVPCSEDASISLDMDRAMKTETNSSTSKRLHLELQILREIDKHCKSKNCTRHFCEPLDYGNTKNFNWVVMTLIGPSLEVVRKLLATQFSRTTVIKMSLQILQAMKVLHDIGIIHRDLKPGNICVGSPSYDDTKLYLLDFGISRRIFEKPGKLRPERPKVPFFGTRRFCSRASHMEKDQGRKDDVESFLYTILDLFHSEKGLTWNKELTDKAKILKLKADMFRNPKNELDPMIPEQIRNLISYITCLTFVSEVDYKLIETELKNIGTTEGLKLKDNFDWQGNLESLMKNRDKNKMLDVGKRSSEEGRRSGDGTQSNSADLFYSANASSADSAKILKKATDFNSTF